MQPSHEELSAEVARLKRRLERERSTRLQAESIAEKGLRDLYERQQQLQLLERIATAANQFASVEEVIQFAVNQICAFADWQVGHSFLAVGSADTRRLRSTGLWHAADPNRIAEFRRVTEAMEFSPGIGLPGRALSSGKPLWVNDVTNDSNFPRHPAARNCGLKAAIAFPVLSGDEVVAVLEFFAGDAREPDQPLLKLMSHVGLQLGRVIERERAGNKLRLQTIELAQARDEARSADRAKSAFLANMSHELRTPLNAIIGFSEMIRDELVGPLDRRYKDYAADIHLSSLHLKDILNDIIDISKVEVGRMELRDECVSIPKTVEECHRSISVMAAAGGVSLSYNLPASLPQIRSERMRLKQIFFNLMSNAVKFTPRGGRVSVSARVEPDGIVIEIRDTGIGIKSEDIAVALEPFRQIDSALNRRYEGTGLGLPLTKAIVELHGGLLEIQSTPGAGTGVFVRLPAERIIDAASPLAPHLVAR